MARKSKSVALSAEVLAPARRMLDVRGALEKMVEQKIAAMMGDNENAIFEPFFRTQAVAHAITREQSVLQQNKWTYYFDEWGCLVCSTREATHYALGMCQCCHSRIRERLRRILKRAEASAKEKGMPVARDLMALAQESLRPTLKALPTRRTQ